MEEITWIYDLRAEVFTAHKMQIVSMYEKINEVYAKIKSTFTVAEAMEIYRAFYKEFGEEVWQLIKAGEEDESFDR